MSNTIKIADREVGDGQPVFIVAEIGINHNGDVEIAKELIDLAEDAGCDAVKFQKRTPDVCVPEEQKEKMRDTPWGYISYLEYKKHVEFWKEEYDEIEQYCENKDLVWFASCWDVPSVDFVTNYDVPCLKIASASLTDHKLLSKMRETELPLILSTGMSTMEEIEEAVEVLDEDNLLITHCTSSYPAPLEELNLRMIPTLREKFDCPIGYSGHEKGLPPSVAAVALGATLVERHITLDRSMWGSDHAASVAPIGLRRLVNHIRAIETALGDGTKQVYESEIPIRKKLRNDTDISD